MKTDFYVYVHKRKTDGVVFYVGKGRAGRACSGANRNRFWHNVVNKHGVDAEIVADCLLEVEAFSIEMDLIAKYREDGVVLVNQTNGGEGTSGWVMPDSVKNKIGAANKGKGVGVSRGPRPDHVKQKISQKQSGVPRPYATGLKRSDETKKDISEKIKKWHAQRRANGLGVRSKDSKKKTSASLLKFHARRLAEKQAAVAAACSFNQENAVATGTNFKGA